MTTTPAPRRGLFCAHFSALCARFFAPCSHFSGFCGDGQGASFFVQTFRNFRSLFLLGFSRSFAYFFIRLFPPFRPFSGGILRQFRRLFLCCFLLCLQAPGRDRHGQPEPAAEGAGWHPFCARFLRILSARQRPENRTDTGRSGNGQARGRLRGISSFFPVPLLCHFCAAMAAHACPPWHTPNNEKPRYQAVFG